jgi:DNA-binding transcriptional regulator YdaS (Cro superfamily)
MTEISCPTGIELALNKAGTQAQLAQILGVTQQSISEWHRRGWVPVDRAEEIERLTGVARLTLIKPRLRELLEAQTN